MNQPVTIIGIEHHNTLSMIRDFGQNNIPVELISYGMSNTYISTSKYIVRSYHVESASQAVSKLKQVILESNYKPVVITCTDEIAALIDFNYNEFRDTCYCFNAGEVGRLSYYMSKFMQSELASQSGFLVPNMKEGLPLTIDTQSIQLPCLIKPKESIHGGKQFYICRRRDELTKSLKNFNPKYEVLVQDYVEKDYEIVILGLSINGNHIIPGYVKKHRDYKGGTTYCTTYDCSSIPQEILDACIKMLTAIRYSGLWGIECIIKDNKYYFIELNLRNDATTYAISKAGTDLPLMFYNFCLQKGSEKNTKVRKIDAMIEFGDFNFVLKLKVSPLVWFRQYRKCECLYYKDETDIVPYKIQLKKYLRFLRKRILKV